MRFDTNTEEEILKKTIDLPALVKSNPELFDLNSLSINDKILLLKENPSFYVEHLNVPGMKVEDRARIVLGITKKLIPKNLDVTPAEAKTLNGFLYTALVMKDFNRYIDKYKYEALDKDSRESIFLRNPDWVMTNINVSPKLTKYSLEILSCDRADFIDKHFSDILSKSVNEMFWSNMFKYDSKYKEIFLKNTHTVTTKTDVRHIVRRYPDLVKHIRGDMLANSKLSAKEWILLIDEVVKDDALRTKESPKRKSIFENWTLPQDVIDIFKLDLTAEMLSGKSKLTTRFQNALKGVFVSNEQNEEEVKENNETSIAV